MITKEFMVNPKMFEFKLEDYIEPDEDEENYQDYYSINNYFISPNNQYIAVVILRTEHKPTCYFSYEYFVVIKKIQTSEQIYRGNTIDSRSTDEIECQYSHDSSLFVYEAKRCIMIYDIIKKEEIIVEIDYDQLLFFDQNRNLFLSQNFELIIYSTNAQLVNFDTDDKLIQGFKTKLIYQLLETGRFFIHDYEHNKSQLLWKGKIIDKFIVFKNQFILEIINKQRQEIRLISNQKLIRKYLDQLSPYFNFETNNTIKLIKVKINSQKNLEICFFDAIKGTQKQFSQKLDKALQSSYEIKVKSQIFGRLVDPGYLIFFLSN